ncbi:ABC transporter permease [Microbacterium kunmingense]|uniref:ABC transporter permease n=1 Tax=Microbacterium kunmingense TaxID=2915939 RepID=UPI003D72F931
MIVAVMLTTGRTVGAEQEVLSSIDSAGTRSIIVRAESDAGVTSDVLDRMGGVSGVEWAAAFSSAIDATNVAVRDGARVPVRYAYGDDLHALGIPDVPVLPETMAYASPSAMELFGLPDRAGGIALTSGEEFGVGGLIQTPDFLKEFEPLVILAEPTTNGMESVNIVVVVAESPEMVAPVADAVLSVLAATDPSKVSVETSEALAQLRALVQSQLSGFSRGLVLALLAVTSALIAILLYGLVMLRRKDYGRRRALGATRGLIVQLLITQTALLAVIGVVVGLTTSIGILVVTADPLPGPSFMSALGILAVTTACVAALVPATLASRREPIHELRVP